MNGKWITSTVLMLGMGLAAAGLMQAQQGGSQTATEATANQNAAGTASGKLQLSPEQKKQLRELRATARDQAAVIRNDRTLSAADKQSKLQELRATTREKMKSVLTPEQQSTFAANRDARRARIAEKLGLTPEQQSKLKDLFRSTHEQRQGVLANSSLSNDQKMSQLKQIRESAKTQLATILTPEQMQKFREMRKGHRHMGGMEHQG